jgi:hypothetical protein
VIKQTEELIAEIKRRARIFADDNLIGGSSNPGPREYLMIENAFLLGASIVFEQETKNEGA